MLKIFNLLAIFLSFFLIASHCVFTSSFPATKEEDEADYRLLGVEATKRLSPEGQKAFAMIDQLVTSAKNASIKTDFQQQLEGELKKLTDVDVETVFEVFAKAKNDSTRAFSGAIQKISPEGRRLMLSVVMAAGLQNEQFAGATIQKLGVEDQQVLLKAMIENASAHGSITPEQKAVIVAMQKMSPEGKRLMLSTLFSVVFKTKDEGFRAGLKGAEQLGAGDRQILKEAVMAAAAKNGENKNEQKPTKSAAA